MKRTNWRWINNWIDLWLFCRHGSSLLMSFPEGFHLNPASRVCPIDRTLQPTPLPSFLRTYIPKVRQMYKNQNSFALGFPVPLLLQRQTNCRLFSCRLRLERMYTAAVIAVLLMKFKTCYRGVRIFPGASYCMVPLTLKTWNMPSSTCSLHPSADWKEPRPKMVGRLCKFQVCWNTSHFNSVRFCQILRTQCL